MANKVLLNLQFDENGCTDTRVVNLGGVTFNEPSPLVRKSLRCATYNAFDKSAGLYIDDIGIRNAINGQEFTIYFKYKIDRSNISDQTIVPLLSYFTNNEYKGTLPLLCIQNGYLTFYFDKYHYINSTDISYTLDGSWHTICIQKKTIDINKQYMEMYIDGCKRVGLENFGYDVVKVPTESPISITSRITIGYNIDREGDITTFNGGSIDNFCIIDRAVYSDSFIPPSEYFYGEDTANNYFLNAIYNNENIEDDTEKEVVKAIEHSKNNRREIIKGYTPQRIDIEWWQETEYFKKEENIRTIPHDRNETILTIRLLDKWINLFNDRFLEGNLYKLYQNGKINPFMMFIDNKFYKLSELDIIKSDDYFNIFVKTRDHELNPSVKRVDIVEMPFPVFYEEGMGERENLRPIYVFDENGKFTPDSGYTYYYIDPKSNPHLKTTGIYEQYYPIHNGSEKDKDSRYMHSVWRYGHLEQRRVSSSGNSVYMYFMAWDQGYIKPGDTVILYKNTVEIDPTRYRIIGYDLIEFFDYKNQNLTNDLVTMQVLTDADEEHDMLEDYTTTRYARVVATEDDQSVFKIPEVTDNDGLIYRKFLIFKGSVCLDNKNRYIINYDDNTITLTDTNDYLKKGRSLLFVFIKINRADAYGPLHVQPIYLYKYMDNKNPNEKSRVTTIPIPSYKKLDYSMKNIILFVNDTFISPRRYRIENNVLYFMDSKTDGVFSGASLIFVLLRMSNELEDPTTDQGRIVKDQLEKGKRFVLFDMDIDKKIKIELENLICFDQNGEFIPDLYGYIYNTNIIKDLHTSNPVKRVPRYLTCIYYDDTLENLSNTVLYNNTVFVKSYIRAIEEFYELDTHFDEFIKDFNHVYRYDKHYGTNLATALNYIVKYNQNILDRVYEDRSTATRKTHSGEAINKFLIPKSNKYELVSYNDGKFKNFYHHTYPIYFLNGELAPFNKNLDYKWNKTSISLNNKFNNNDCIEEIDFHNMKNYLVPLKSKVNKDKSSEYFIKGQLAIGNVYNYYLNSLLTVVKYTDREFSASITVPEENYNLIKNDLSKEFKAMMIVPTSINKDFLLRITVDDIKNGEQKRPFPPGSDEMDYEIYCRIKI